MHVPQISCTKRLKYHYSKYNALKNCLAGFVRLSGGPLVGNRDSPCTTMRSHNDALCTASLFTFHMKLKQKFFFVF